MLIIMYALPPILTIVVANVNIIVYWYWNPRTIYGLLMSAGMAIGWLITILFWGNCAVRHGSRLQKGRVTE